MRVSVVSILVAVTTAVPADGGSGPSRSARAPERIVTISPNAAEIICALGDADRIVGVSRYCTAEDVPRHVPRVGGLFDPDLEKIVALRPDVVVLRGRSEPVERLCRKHGIRIHEDNTNRLSDIERCITEVGLLLNKDAEAQALAARFRRDLDAVRARTAGKTRPRVFITLNRDPDALANLLTAGRGNFLDEMITAAGGRNVFGEVDMMYPQVSPEAILARQPEVIIELMPDRGRATDLENQVRVQWARLGGLPAVEDGRVYVLTDARVQIPSHRYPEVIAVVSRLLHPEPDDDR